MRSHPAVLAAVTGLATLAALTGCSVGFPGSTASSSHPRATSTSGVFGYVYGDNAFATQEHLTALIADQILVP